MGNLLDIATEVGGTVIDRELKQKIDICYRLRKLANLDRIKLKNEVHANEISDNLFRYLKLCGKDPEQFAKEYIANLHPFMIERRKDQEYKDSIICVLDKFYSVSLYIKVDSQKMEEVIISFHESHTKGIGRLNFGKRRNERVPVIANSIKAHINGTDMYTIDVRIQRGILVVPIEVSARKIGGEYYVLYSDIETALVGLCNAYIEDVYCAREELNIDDIAMFSYLQQLSFPSYGRDNVSTIFLLIDSFYAQNDILSRSAADFALVTYVRNLILDDKQKNELVSMLEDRFKVQSRKGADEFVKRIVDNIESVIDNE